jgi:hypothetical protein
MDRGSQPPIPGHLVETRVARTAISFRVCYLVAS